MKKNQNGYMLVELVVLLIIVAGCILIGYTLVHFISKFW